MSIPLLATKFNIPPLRPQLISRLRLIHKLNVGLEQSCLLTLVCAPAGYGKTTLLREWLQTLTEKSFESGTPPVRCAWITLDQGDDDLACFLNYLVAALQKVNPGIGNGLLTCLQAPRPSSGQVLATLLINDLNEISDRVLLVMDDYHLIAAQPIHDFLSFLVEHQPLQLCVIIASRADPPLPLSRWRSRGQLVEVRQEDLHFTHEESAEFLGKALGIPLTSEQLLALEMRTEGWVAGLQLAALSMRNLTDASAFIDAFSGGHEHIADYLTDEVIAQQSEAVVSFLLQTSILEHLTAPLCEAVTGQTRAQKTLEYLMEANLFLVQLDHGQEWYRYHTLFSDLLRKRLYIYCSEQENELHIRASRWYQDNGFLPQAIEHALLGKDFDRAAVLIEHLAEDSLARGETLTLLRWLETLPADIKDHHLILWVLNGLALLLCGKSDTSVQASLDRFSDSAAAGSVQGEMAFLQALRAVMEGKAADAVSLAEIALQQIPPDRLFFRCFAADSLGMAHTLRGDTEAAIQAYEQVVELSTRAGNDMMTICALSSLAGLHTVRGQLRISAAMYQNVMELAEERFGKHSPYSGRALLGLGELAREWNDLDAALRYFLDSVEALGKFSEIGLAVSYISIARVKLSQCDWEAVQAYIAKARHQARQSKSTQLDDLLTDMMESRYWIVHGELDRAMQWVRSRGLLDRSVEETIGSHGQNVAVNEFTHGNYLVLARLFLALEQPDEALRIIEPLLGISLKIGHYRRGIEYLALNALALQQNQNMDQAIEIIGEALRLGEAEGFQRIFLDEGKPMAKLLYLAVEGGIYPVYAGKLLSGFSSAEFNTLQKTVETNPDEVLVEPLSEREKEVLALIVEGLSNSEIAGRLYISLSTVKGHTAHIFGKLGVRSRTQAVSRARDFGLIPDHEGKPLQFKTVPK